ncbi:uncharacterized protein (TIGR01777 family) [Oxalobacteraceae bacterium GrIS 2.11]
MQILITGGTGLIGRSLCQALLNAGHELTVLSRQPGSVAKKCGNAVIPMASLNEWTAQRSFDAVINLAGEPIVDAAWTDARKKVLWDSRVSLTEDLVKHIAAAKHKPSILLSGSAIGYYGDCGDLPLTEAAPPGDDFAAALCKAWEQAASAASEQGVRVCLMRTGLVLASQGGLFSRMILPFKLGLGARLGNGRQWMSWIHIDDYVAAVIALLDNPDANGAFNMTAAQPVTNQTFTKKLAAAVHRPAWFVAPAALLKVALGARSILLIGGQQVLPARLQAQGFRFKFDQLDAALQALIKVKS